MILILYDKARQREEPANSPESRPARGVPQCHIALSFYRFIDQHGGLLEKSKRPAICGPFADIAGSIA